MGRWDDQARLESALQEITRLGFDTIRTWDTNAYTGRILQAIVDLGLNLKVQAGIYLRKDSDAEQKIVTALQTINSHPDLVIGVSLGNEQLADWNNTGLTVADVIQHINLFREFSEIPLTYNFSGETLRGNSSFWAQNGEELLRKLDYINVHSYAGFFDNRWNPEWTPGRQIEVLKLDEALFRKTLDNFGLHSTPLILGETGWQSVGGAQSVTNAENMETYFQSTRDYIQGDLARFDAMFYFNLSDESWKGGDNHWGLFEEGGSDSLGAAKFDIDLDVVPESQLLLVADSGSARLLVDDTTGLAFIQQNASDQPLLIRRNDSYWQGDIPLQRGDAALVSAAVDEDGQLRVLDRGPWGDFSWILDPSGLFIGEDAPGVLSVPETEELFQIDLDADGIIPAPPSPESDAQDERDLRVVADSGSARLLVDDTTGLAFIQQNASDQPLLIRRNDSYWQGDIPLQRGDAALVSAAVDEDGQLRVLDRGPWGDFSWILDPSGLFIGEDAPGVLSVPETEELFQIDLDADGIIPAPPSPESDAQDERDLRVVADSGSARLLVDDTTGLAFIQQNASDQPLLIRRNDSYWQGDIPLQRGDAALVSAAVDEDGQLRVLDRGPWGDFSWILDPSGLFIGEDAPGVLSVPETEELFQIDLDADGIIPAPPSPESDAQDELNSNTVSAFEATGFNQGEFVSTIAFSHRATVDPIVAPGNTKFMHAHDFFANPTTGASSTVASLMDASDTAAIPINNISTYWTPSLIDEGSDGVGGEQTYVTPKATSIAYYSVLKPNEPSELVNMPIGLKMIAGSARPQNRQSRAQVFWNYIGELASYDHIPLGDEWRDLPLQAVIIFPEYWTGQSLDSPDHKSHVAYGDGSGVGPNEHPLLIPQLQLQIHYGRINNNLHLVSSDYMSLPEAGGDLDLRLQRGNPDDLSFRNGESGFAPGWSMHADQIHLPWEEVAPNGETVDGFARRETDALMLPLFAGTDGNSVRIIPTGIQQPYSAERSPMPMLGSPGNDVLTGSSSDDRLESLEGDDILIGGGGADRLVGGDGADRFVIESINESTLLRPDVLVGFAPEDRLDLRGLNLKRDDLILQSTGPSSWFLTASDTDLGIVVRTDSITFEQIMIDGGHLS
ncbi:hypothetical protein SynBMKMC1_01362 [Synechococcus sp. BMK-MC-1]|nr:hypothetical protein SynBMKMC1_01362 [Synechococcus sp. BMK-MC-1]